MPVGRTGGFGEQLLLHGCFVRVGRSEQSHNQHAGTNRTQVQEVKEMVGVDKHGLSAYQRGMP
jgi:hypothetical protein